MENPPPPTATLPGGKDDSAPTDNQVEDFSAVRSTLGLSTQGSGDHVGINDKGRHAVVDLGAHETR